MPATGHVVLGKSASHSGPVSTPDSVLNLTFSVCAAWSPGSREGHGGSRVGVRSPASSHLPPGVGQTPPCAPGPGSVNEAPAALPHRQEPPPGAVVA